MRFLFFCFLCLCTNVFAQTESNISIENKQDKATASVEIQYYSLSKSDNVNNYYIVDFTKFPSQFERIFFKSLIFKSKIIVSIDADLTKESVLFQTNKKYEEAVVKPEFDQIIAKTILAKTEYSDIQKNDIINKFNKK